MAYTRVVVIVILTLITISLTGCFSSHPKDIEAFLKPRQVNVTADTYVLQPPDRIEIRCSKVPEIDRQPQQIRPDGMLSFEGLGEIEAAGRTIEEVANSIRAKVLELYRIEGTRPVDSVIMSFRSKVYYVLGEVYVPGKKEYTGRDSVLTALAEAQLNPMAWKQRIQVIRPSSNPNIRPKIFEIDYDKLAAHGDASKNVLLQEGDVIYVPPTILAGIAQVIEEFARPIGRAFSTVNVVTMGTAGGGGYGGGYGY